MSSLLDKHSIDLPSGTPALDANRIAALLREVPGFALGKDGQSIARKFEFENYYQTMAFVNAVAYLVHLEDHHPDLEVSYNACTVRYSTHSVGGLSENDFICAAKVNALV